MSEKCGGKIRHGVTESTETHGEARMASGVVSGIKRSGFVAGVSLGGWSGAGRMSDAEQSRAKRGPTTPIGIKPARSLRALRVPVVIFRDLSSLPV